MKLCLRNSVKQSEWFEQISNKLFNEGTDLKNSGYSIVEALTRDDKSCSVP